ncbi:alkane hydroxylase MAH1-like [Andrographis paniculata]|uniref:alkane hydroxylase MAH1-like n=1 Tax=Andrographis paniculata TaxID=175694 RepID=UPI0021E71FD9|nr:alkane hydroxylase MAH1-like [Andrographis paniculata]
MASLTYLEIAFALICVFYIWCFRNINGLPWNWPLLGMLPALFCHVHRVHDRCVDLFRLTGGTFHLKGPWFASMDIVVTGDPANVHFIMSANFTNFPKGPEFKKIFDVLGDGIFNSDSELWSRHRKIARSLISHEQFRRFLLWTSLEKVEHGLVPVLEHFSAGDLIVDLQDVFQRFTFDTTCMLVTGFDPGCLSPELPDVPFSRAMDEAEEAIFMRHCLPESLWKLERWLGIGHEKKMSRARAILDEIINKYISRKREELSRKGRTRELSCAGKNGVDLLTSYMEGDESFDDEFLRDTILNFMIAGRDTTSSALTWFTWLVSTHPEVEKKIRQELAGVTPEENDRTRRPRVFGSDEVRGLVYLHGALCETLRLYPPVPFQHKAPVQGVVLPSGHYVDAKMKVMFSLYAMGRMEYIWGKDAGEFRPERWITERGTIKHEPSYKFLAFNAGPRTCLGKEVAFTQLKAVAAAMLHNYKVEPAEGHRATPNVSVILYMKNGFKVKISRR